MLVLTRGAGPCDDLHLLRDVHLADVQVAILKGMVDINVCGPDDHFYVAKDRADELVAGRVVQCISLSQGQYR